MKKVQIALVFLLGTAVGVGVAAFWLCFSESRVPSRWITLSAFDGSENYDISSYYEAKFPAYEFPAMQIFFPMEGYPTKASELNSSSPFPCPVVKVNGKARFNIGEENRKHGTSLGYIVNLNIGPQPAIPVMQTPGVTPVQPGEIFVSPSGDKFTIPTSISDPAPLDLGALNFVLKDADGFVLMSTSSGDFTIKPNTQERFQGLALEGVSFADAKRTRRIAVRVAHRAGTCDTAMEDPILRK